MGNRTRSARFKAEVDAKLVEVADARGVALNVVINEAVEQYLGFRRSVSMVEVPVSPKEGIVPVTSANAGSPVGREGREVREVRSIRCLCESPVGEIYCEICGKIR